MTITRTGYTRQHHTSWLERNNYNQLLMLVSRHRTILPLNINYITTSFAEVTEFNVAVVRLTEIKTETPDLRFLL